MRSEARALIRGTHTQQFTPDLLLRVQANLVTDRNYSATVKQLGNATGLAQPRVKLVYHATAALWESLFARSIPAAVADREERIRFSACRKSATVLPNLSLFNSPILLGADTNFVNFYREQGFTQNRMDVLPGLSTDVLDFGHIVGLTPQVKVREVYYTRGVQNSENQHRETFWAGLDATSKLSRRFGTSEGNTLLHTIEPSVMYEYVPSTNQSTIDSDRSSGRSAEEKLIDLRDPQPIVGTRWQQQL